jgi:AcrR family transcriptional regulator
MEAPLAPAAGAAGRSARPVLAATPANGSAAHMAADTAMVAPVAAARSGANGRQERQRAVSDHRRSLILDAANEVFQATGLDGANIREIARRAGYTPGAIYFYFRSKEDIYGELLAASLERLNAAVANAGARSRAPRTRLLAKATAFYAFYANHPRDLDLGFYLFHGMKPHGLTPELNEQLNTRLRDALEPTQAVLLDMGLAPADALREVTAFFGHCVGLLLLQNTGRIRMFKQDPAMLLKCYIEQLYQRSGGQ